MATYDVHVFNGLTAANVPHKLIKTAHIELHIADGGPIANVNAYVRKIGKVNLNRCSRDRERAVEGISHTF